MPVRAINVQITLRHNQTILYSQSAFWEHTWCKFSEGDMYVRCGVTETSIMAIMVRQASVSQRQRLLISVWEKIVGKPYWGKPDVRFDEGGVETGHDGEPAACDS